MPHLADTQTKSQSSKPWTVNAPLSFFAHDLTDRERVVFQVIDCHARLDTYCFVGYQKIATITRKAVRSVHEIMAVLEEKGFIRILHAQGKNSSRVGIILLKRVNPGETPAADTLDAIKRAEAVLRNRPSKAARAEIRMRKLATDLTQEATEKQRGYSQSDFSEYAREDSCAPHDEIYDLSPASTPVVSEEDDDAQERSRRKMVDLVKRLARMDEDDPDARDTVDEFAAVSLAVVLDSKASFKYHCKVGLALIRRRLSIASAIGVMDAFAVKHDNLELYHEPGWYVSEMDPLIGIDMGEAANN